MEALSQKNRIKKYFISLPKQECTFCSTYKNATGKIQLDEIFREVRKDYIKKWLRSV